MSEGCWLVLIGGAIAFYVYSHAEKNRLIAKYGDELQVYNAAAFADSVEDSHDPKFVIVTRLGHEIQSRKGQRAIRMYAPGMAIQHINTNGTFSKKGPYFVSKYSSNWRATDTTHVIQVLRGKGSNGFAPDHYNQQGCISEKGIAILEYNTSKHYSLSIHDYALRRDKIRRR